MLFSVKYTLILDFLLRKLHYIAVSVVYKAVKMIYNCKKQRMKASAKSNGRMKS